MMSALKTIPIMAIKSLYELPSEVIHHILLHIDPQSLPVLELVSKRSAEFANQQVIWQYHCRNRFSYWNSERRIGHAYKRSVADTDWKCLYIERHKIDRDITRSIDSILSSQTGRIRKFGGIVDFGHEAKDTLLRHCNATDEAEDVLARRYYSRAVLESLHRSLAIQQWSDVQHERHVPLEKALAAFDMFNCHDEEDFDIVSERLNRLALQAHEHCPQFAARTSRQQALDLAKYLRQNNFIGVRDPENYHDLSNNFIGMALRDEDHETLPLVMVAIYCCVAQRLGLDAQPCGFPLHVHAIIKSPPGQDLDGRIGNFDLEFSSMYMDPWKSDLETPVQDLLAKLQTMKIESRNLPILLGPSTTAEIVRRTARNIITSVRTRSHSTGIGGHLNFPPDPAADNAFYGALWALLLLSEGGNDQSWQQEQLMPQMLQHIEREFPFDLGLFVNNALPLLRKTVQYEQLCGSIQHKLDNDALPKTPKKRHDKVQKGVRYKIGQVFRHKRYHYSAVVTGWDVECEAGEVWIAQMNVRSLSGGRHQPFYHVMVEDNSNRYVAEENIEIETPETVGSNLMAIAGQHFKRWDRTTSCFISNIWDEYPND